MENAMKKMLLTFCAVLALCLAGCAKGGSYTAGTYTASAKGMGGDVNVSVTFSKSAITKIEIGARYFRHADKGNSRANY